MNPAISKNDKQDNWPRFWPSFRNHVRAQAPKNALKMIQLLNEQGITAT